MSLPRRVDRRNATFQHWQSLLGNRSKRHRTGEVLVQGVRPITVAVDAGLEVVALLADADARRSAWSRETIERSGAPVVAGRTAGSERVVPNGAGRRARAPRRLSRSTTPMRRRRAWS